MQVELIATLVTPICAGPDLVGGGGCICICMLFVPLQLACADAGPNLQLQFF